LYEEGSQRSHPQGDAKKIQAGGVLTQGEEEASDLESPTPSDISGPIVARDAFNGSKVVVNRKLTAGFVIYIGNPEKLHRKSVQFHLPIQFFLPFFCPVSVRKRVSRETVISREAITASDEKNA